MRMDAGKKERMNEGRKERTKERNLMNGWINLYIQIWMIEQKRKQESDFYKGNNNANLSPKSV